MLQQVLYIKILNEAITEEKGEVVTQPKECLINLSSDAFLPKSYCKTSSARMEMYKKIAHITSYDDYEDVLDEICDRYGDPPSSAMNLIRIALIRALAIQANITKIEEIGDTIRLFPSEIKQQALVELAKTFPQNNIRVSLGEVPYIYLKLRKPQKNIPFLIDLLEKYNALLAQ